MKNQIQCGIANEVLAEGFLLPMTDFIDKYLHTGDAALQIRILSLYKDFIKQPLKIEMFAPEEKGKELFQNVTISKNWLYCSYSLSGVTFAKLNTKTLEFVPTHGFDKIENLIQLKPKLTHSAFSEIFGKTFG